jgi:hypothetical protein
MAKIESPGDGSRVASAEQDPVHETAAADKDVALAIVGEHAHDIDPAVEARVIRKIDWFLIPAMIVGYGLVYYDKVHPAKSRSLAMAKAYTTTRQYLGVPCCLE